MFDEDAVVLKYYLYRAVGGPGFIYPVYVLYLLSHGLSYTQIGVIGAVQSVVVLVGELPTGYVGDRIGRRNSLVVGQVVFAASALGMLLGEGFAAFLLAFSLLSVGQTFVSGSGDAWLYDTLEERLDADRFAHVRGRGGAVGQWVMAATMVLGGLLYVAGHRLPFAAALVMRLGTVGAVTLLPKNAQYADRDGGAGEDLTVLDALPLIRERLTTPALRAFLAFVAVFFGAAMTVDAYVQPVTVDALEASLGGLLAARNVPEAATLGVVYAAFTATSAVASDRASDLEAALGRRRMVLVVPALTGVVLLAPLLAPVLAFPAFFGLRGATAVMRPVAGQHVNDHVESVGRATVLSAVSMVYALVRVPYAVGSGVLADLGSPLVAVAAMGGVVVVAAGVARLVTPLVAMTDEDDEAGETSESEGSASD